MALGHSHTTQDAVCGSTHMSWMKAGGRYLGVAPPRLLESPGEAIRCALPKLRVLANLHHHPGHLQSASSVLAQSAGGVEDAAQHCSVLEWRWPHCRCTVQYCIQSPYAAVEVNPTRRSPINSRVDAYMLASCICRGRMWQRWLIMLRFGSLKAARRVGVDLV
jgi:hypothetical protein